MFPLPALFSLGYKWHASWLLNGQKDRREAEMWEGWLCQQIGHLNKRAIRLKFYSLVCLYVIYYTSKKSLIGIFVHSLLSPQFHKRKVSQYWDSRLIRVLQKNNLVSYNLYTVHVPYDILFNNIQLISLQIVVLKLREQMCITKPFDSDFEETKQVCI